MNTTNGSSVYQVAFALVWADGTQPVLNQNSAHSFASCANCETTAVAFQVVLIVGDAHLVPQNLSGALNYQCVSCVTQALAEQLVINTFDAGERRSDGGDQHPLGADHGVWPATTRALPSHDRVKAGWLRDPDRSTSPLQRADVTADEHVEHELDQCRFAKHGWIGYRSDRRNSDGHSDEPLDRSVPRGHLDDRPDRDDDNASDHHESDPDHDDEPNEYDNDDRPDVDLLEYAHSIGSTAL